MDIPDDEVELPPPPDPLGEFLFFLLSALCGAGGLALWTLLRSN